MSWLVRARVLALLSVLTLAAVFLAVGASGASAASGGNLDYRGGPVLHPSAPYLVFWAPSGESIPAQSKTLIERFLTDAAADSGKASNVFGVLRQYYDHAGFADYQQTFNPGRQVIVDTHPYPAHDPGCSAPDSAYPTCISDPQIQSELLRLIAADRLPTDGLWDATALPARAPVYFVILPDNVNVCWEFYAVCANRQACAYHGAGVTNNQRNFLYAAIPLHPLQDGSTLFPAPKRVCQIDGTSAVQALDGDVNADLAIDALSHEYSETITDPTGNGSWEQFSTANEIGDKCEMNTTAKLPTGFGNNPRSFLPTLGGNAARGTLFTQLINGHPYYLQSEWSNGAGACEMRPLSGTITSRFTVSSRRLAGSLIRFDPAASTSTRGDASATWSFGDGSKTAFFSGRATLKLAAHRYRRAGTYTVRLTLVDTQGNLKTTTRRVTIRPQRK